MDGKLSDPNNNTYLSYLVQPRLHGQRQRLPSLKVLWIRIFSYSGPTEKETVLYRCFCKLFSKALKPLPCWTIFPHPNYSSLEGLFGRFDELSENGSTNIPTVLFIANGVHEIEHYHNRRVYNSVKIKISISIVGESCEHCIIIGGLWLMGKKENNVNVKDLTLKQSTVHGLYGAGASFHLDNVSVENSKYTGIFILGTKRNTMKNCQVSHSKRSGLYVKNKGLVTIDGNATAIHNNVISIVHVESREYYGLKAGYSSSILLVSPLTKESISTNNGIWKEANYCGNSTIKTITNTAVCTTTCK